MSFLLQIYLQCYAPKDLLRYWFKQHKKEMNHCSHLSSTPVRTFIINIIDKLLTSSASMFIYPIQTTQLFKSFVKWIILHFDIKKELSRDLHKKPRRSIERFLSTPSVNLVIHPHMKIRDHSCF